MHYGPTQTLYAKTLTTIRAATTRPVPTDLGHLS